MRARIAIAAVILLAAVGTAGADEWVNGYYRSNGTYVEGHHRSSPNSNRYDNYSSQGNTNPYTGERGYKRNEFSNPPAYNQRRGSAYNKSWSSGAYE